MVIGCQKIFNSVVLKEKEWKGMLTFLHFFCFVGLPYQGKDIVFRFIIDCSSSRDFGP